MHSEKPKILFVTLRTFSLTGGVEKVSRGIGFALKKLEREGEINFQMISLYDENGDEKYVPKKNFKGYQGKRLNGMLGSIKSGLSADIVILSHINLAPVGWAIKRLRPSVRVIVWTHGVEIWRPLNMIKRSFLKICDNVVAVSRFTANEIQRLHNTGQKSVTVIPNALDPFFKVPDLSDNKLRCQAEELRIRHGIPTGQKVFMALTRLRITEKNKNYDKVIRLLGELKKEGRTFSYVLCGKYDIEEESRIKSVAAAAGMESELILTGFVEDKDLSTYYVMADAFVLPSTKEGFGLAFIEAQACGLYVLAGNTDGSTEAVRSSEAGILVDPTEDTEIRAALNILLERDSSFQERIANQEQCLAYFNFERFEEDLEALIPIKKTNITLNPIN